MACTSASGRGMSDIHSNTPLHSSHGYGTVMLLCSKASSSSTPSKGPRWTLPAHRADPTHERKFHRWLCSPTFTHPHRSLSPPPRVSVSATRRRWTWTTPSCSSEAVEDIAAVGFDANDRGGEVSTLQSSKDASESAVHVWTALEIRYC